MCCLFPCGCTPRRSVLGGFGSTCSLRLRSRQPRKRQGLSHRISSFEEKGLKTLKLKEERKFEAFKLLRLYGQCQSKLHCLFPKCLCLSLHQKSVQLFRLLWDKVWDDPYGFGKGPNELVRNLIENHIKVLLSHNLKYQLSNHYLKQLSQSRDLHQYILQQSVLLQSHRLQFSWQPMQFLYLQQRLNVHLNSSLKHLHVSSYL